MSNKYIYSFFEERATNWDSYAFHDQKMISFLLNKINIKNDDSILDVGCGTGAISFNLSKLTSNKVIAIDLSNKMIEIARNKKHDDNLNFICCDFYDHKFNEKFDKIIIFDAYPHFIELDKFKISLINNLKDNGMFVIMHDLGRGKLQTVHEGRNVSCISRKISDPLTESKFYDDEFDLLSAFENEDYYFLMMQKKGNCKNILSDNIIKDIREKKTDENIISSFFKILECKKYDSISIYEIIKESNISSSTFYSHFKNKDEIIYRYIDKLFSHIYDAHLLKEVSHDFSNLSSKKDFINHLFSHAIEERKNFILLVNNCKEILISSLQIHLKPLIEYYINNSIIKNKGIPFDYFLNLNIDFLVTYFLNWINNYSFLDSKEACEYYFKMVI